MAKKMLIVESPAKAKTISKYLDGEFLVKSSFGHVRDLDKGNKAIDKTNGFKATYIVSPEKKKVVKELKDAAKKVSEVWLATDEDREGEAIAWHLCEVLGLDEDTTKRIVFREITKPAIQKAVTEPRLIDKNLVNAQQARRILDRLVGFELSEILWRKVRNKLSAGRVQSVAVKLIVERERDINGFVSDSFFKVEAIFDVKSKSGDSVKLKANLKSNFDDISSAEQFLEKSKGATYHINDIQVKPAKRTPAPPFTTSTLQQEASRKLGFGVSRTMSIAQKLYEQGHITYMRTDSTSLSQSAIDGIKKEVEREFGDNYLKIREYKSKSKNAQEAHEAIRPTYAERQTIEGDFDMQKLYSLIWKRTLASQMADAILEKTLVKIGISSVPNNHYEATGEVIKFDGFLKLYNVSTDEDEQEDGKTLLPPLTNGQNMDLDYVKSTQRFSRPPARYTEAALVKQLEKLGIGRPSTYAPTISKIMEKSRGYITKESRDGKERLYEVLTLKNDAIEKKTDSEITGTTKNRLYASDIAMIVVDFLEDHFENIMKYQFTAEVEDKLDDIAHGKESAVDMLSNFYNPFHGNVEKTIEEAERVNGKKELGVEPESGHTVLVQMTRYGPAVRIGTVEELGEDVKPKFASLRPGQSLETINLEDALELFKLPKTLGDYKDKEVIVASGRYGPFIRYNEKYISIPKGEDPLDVSLERAQELIDIKEKEDAPVGSYKGKDITKGKGRFGPFIKWDGMFINIPRRYDPDNLSQEDMFELVEKKIEKEANRFVKQWPDHQIAIENGRWGPFIRFKKKSVKLPKVDGERMKSEDLVDVELEQVKTWITEEMPDAKFKKVKEPKVKKAKK